MADSRKMDCFGESHASPRNDKVEPLESSLRDSTRSVESWQSIQDSQAKFRTNEMDLSKVCAEILARIAKNRHIIFLLQGDIGAGKTTLVKAFAKYVKIKDSVTSPTFSLLHIYSNSAACGDFSRSASAHFVNGRQSPISSFASHNHENSHTILEFDSSVESADYMLKIYHYDLFNRALGELLDLGLLDLLGENGIHFVEWGDSQLFGILKNAFENICIISIHKTKNDRIYEFKESF